MDFGDIFQGFINEGPKPSNSCNDCRVLRNQIKNLKTFMFNELEIAKSQDTKGEYYEHIKKTYVKVYKRIPKI